MTALNRRRVQTLHGDISDELVFDTQPKDNRHIIQEVQARFYTAAGWFVAIGLVGGVLSVVWGLDWRYTITAAAVLYLLAWSGLFAQMREWLELKLQLDLNRDGVIGVVDEVAQQFEDAVAISDLSGEIVQFSFPDKVQFTRWLSLALQDQKAKKHSLSQNDATAYSIPRGDWQRFMRESVERGWVQERKNQKPIITGQGATVFERWIKFNSTPLP